MTVTVKAELRRQLLLSVVISQVPVSFFFLRCRLFVFFLNIVLFLFLAVLGCCCHTSFSLVAANRGYSLVVVCGSSCFGERA